MLELIEVLERLQRQVFYPQSAAVVALNPQVVATIHASVCRVGGDGLDVVDLNIASAVPEASNRIKCSAMLTKPVLKAIVDPTDHPWAVRDIGAGKEDSMPEPGANATAVQGDPARGLTHKDMEVDDHAVEPVAVGRKIRLPFAEIRGRNAAVLEDRMLEKARSTAAALKEQRQTKIESRSGTPVDRACDRGQPNSVFVEVGGGRSGRSHTCSALVQQSGPRFRIPTRTTVRPAKLVVLRATR